MLVTLPLPVGQLAAEQLYLHLWLLQIVAEEKQWLQLERNQRRFVRSALVEMHPAPIASHEEFRPKLETNVNRIAEGFPAFVEELVAQLLDRTYQFGCLMAWRLS